MADCLSSANLGAVPNDWSVARNWVSQFQSSIESCMNDLELLFSDSDANNQIRVVPNGTASNTFNSVFSSATPAQFAMTIVEGSGGDDQFWYTDDNGNNWTQVKPRGYTSISDGTLLDSQVVNHGQYDSPEVTTTNGSYTTVTSYTFSGLNVNDVINVSGSVGYDITLHGTGAEQSRIKVSFSGAGITDSIEWGVFDSGDTGNKRYQGYSKNYKIGTAGTLTVTIQASHQQTAGNVGDWKWIRRSKFCSFSRLRISD